MVKLFKFKDIGQREYMEDRMSVKKHGSNYLLTVCDGHGGDQCAQFTIARWDKYVLTLMRQNPRMRPLTAMKTSLKTIVKEWDGKCFPRTYPKNKEQSRVFFESVDESYEKRGCTSGTTIASAYVDLTAMKVHVLSLGDSRVVWKLDDVVGATFDHKPDKELKYPGFDYWIEDDEGTLRVNGDLALGSAVGDNTYKLTGVIGRVPNTYTLGFKRALDLIVATDGLWDETSSQDVFRTKRLEGKGQTSDNVAAIYLTV